jgi:rod shape-determining protein MreC
MIALPSRHRSLMLLATVVVSQILLLAVQIKRERKVRLIRVWAVEVITPVQRAGAWTIDHIRGGWHNYVALRHTREENEKLRAELDRLKLRTAELESRALEADRLAALLGFREAHAAVPMLAARVISASADPASKTIYVNRGERDGVGKNMAVITPEGVVGKVLEVFHDTSQVLLLTDKDGGAGALLAGSRILSPVGGTGEPLLVMKYVSNDEPVPNGERVLTSGQDRIFPKDLPVGTVVDVKPGNPFKVIHIKPAAHLDRLEEVLVLLTQQELEPAPVGVAGPKKQTEQSASRAPAKAAPTPR